MQGVQEHRTGGSQKNGDSGKFSQKICIEAGTRMMNRINTGERGGKESVSAFKKLKN
jgi:hypothetical protein